MRKDYLVTYELLLQRSRRNIDPEKLIKIRLV
jgi:hypothetical protein